MRRVALAWLLLAVFAALARPSAAAGSADATLDSLLADYQRYRFPLPPLNAPAVRMDCYGQWCLGFVLRPGSRNQPSVVLIGSEVFRTDQGRALDPVLGEPAVEAPYFARCVGFPFSTNADLATAVQCRARGWNDAARRLLTTGLAASCERIDSQFYAPAGEPPSVMLARVAWSHWANALGLPHSDRAQIARRMEALYAERAELHSVANDELLKALRLTVRESRARPKSAEADIEALVERSDWAPANAEHRLLARGFAAVPALIAHLHDIRLTRGTMLLFLPDNPPPPPHYLRLGEVVSVILEQISGEQFGGDFREGEIVSSDGLRAARAWWEHARREGEERYLLTHVLSSGPPRPYVVSSELALLAAHYPQALPQFYRSVLERNRANDTVEIAKAIGASTLPQPAKVRALLRGTRDPNPEHRLGALIGLSLASPELFRRLLTPALNRVPAGLDLAAWIRGYYLLPEVLSHTDDPRAWALITRIGRRASARFRGYLLDDADGTTPRGQRALWLRFLAAFFDDRSLWTVPGGQRPGLSLGVGFSVRRIAIRDLAAARAAELLGLVLQPQESWTEDEWTDFRAAVRVAAGTGPHL